MTQAVDKLADVVEILGRTVERLANLVETAGRAIESVRRDVGNLQARLDALERLTPPIVPVAGRRGISLASASSSWASNEDEDPRR